MAPPKCDAVAGSGIDRQQLAVRAHQAIQFGDGDAGAHADGQIAGIVVLYLLQPIQQKDNVDRRRDASDVLVHEATGGRDHQFVLMSETHHGSYFFHCARSNHHRGHDMVNRNAMEIVGSVPDVSCAGNSRQFETQRRRGGRVHDCAS